MRIRLMFTSLVCVSWAFAQACGGDSGTDDGGSDGTTGNDVITQPDIVTQDVVTNPDTGPDDTGVPDTGPGDTGPGDANDGGTTVDTGIAQWTCGSVKVADCSLCTGFTQPCAYCNTQDASVLSGVCVQTGQNCFNTIPNGYQDCPCADASTCPEGFQVCTNAGRCHTCTDSTQNNGLKCEDNLTCQIDAGGCK
jgi:hypothetical protein